jgi:methylamine---glutamate N-methyltransferase subunit B
VGSLSTSAEPGAVPPGAVPPGAVRLDLDGLDTRAVNATLRGLPEGAAVVLQHPGGRHNLAVGLNRRVRVTIEGAAGYYCAGLSRLADVTVRGTAGPGVGENLMSGRVTVDGSAGASAASSGRGGLVVVRGNASLRAGISLKGATLAVAGDVGAFCGFMAQAGTILIGGNAGEGLGDSLYEAVIYVAGTVGRLGTDARVEELADADVLAVSRLAADAGFDHIDARNVTRIGSARQLYHFATHNHSAY